MELQTLQKLKDGNHRVFTDLYERFYQKVFGYFMQKARLEDVAQDLTQQTFIKLWQYRSSIDLDLSIDQQLFQKARQVHIDWLRKEAVYRKHIVETHTETEREYRLNSSIEPVVGLKQSLTVAINSLPEKRKEAFELKHVYGLSYKEIAAIMDVSVKTVDNHLLKATSQLRKYFGLLIWFIASEI
ncbi:sigma-70 family RNA polymerase sigma factor [Niabella yanshanensis]|uniref:Sigma-70 family RNA polymerase sigma factor n=1 Tax=Niabella yanshanensis TaxID=577386 RepID=A0ABZ0W525_9BACT|nr:sigma-70 family RNA polymerase sigma factor [Niabella yanshanensis]WQD37738.1 sigma-70 family RNA polymerase sigma factor [Niabella yanshanensis]